MAESIGNGAGRGLSGWRLAGWATAAFLLLLPLIARAPWTGSDFAFAAVMIGGVGLVFELAVRMSPSWTYRAGAATALAAAFLAIWVQASVGIIGDGDNPLNLMFAGVLGLAFIGSALVRFRPAGMARIMTAAALAQFAAGGVGTFTDLRGGIFAALFSGIWLLSALLFQKAAREG